MDEDLKSELLEVVAEHRMNANQNVRQKMIKHLSENVEQTANDPKMAYVLLAALKDSDTIDIKRLGLNQNAQEIDNRTRVLGFLENITSQVSGNPYYSEAAAKVATGELHGRPDVFYEVDDFTEDELEINVVGTNHKDFMRSRNAIPNSPNREESD